MNTKFIAKGILFVFSSASFIFTQAGCVSNAQTVNSANSDKSAQVDANTAKLIAYARLECSRESFREEPFVSDGGETWIVNFNVKPDFEKLTGGGAMIEIEKSSGRVKVAYIGK